MPFLRSVTFRPGPRTDLSRFPCSVPAIRTLGTLDLSAAVTCFVGENGSGKSTLLEGIALAAGLPTVGSDDAASDPTLAQQRFLARHLRLAWTRRVGRGFFLRAEDFFGFARRLAREREEMRRGLDALDAEYADRSEYAKRLAQGPLRASLAEMEARYGTDLDASSHGQGFLTLFRSRFVPGGLYLLDEPEAALSPQSQLALLAMLLDLAEQEAQIIIATHSPILLAYPDACLYSFDEAPPARVAYEDLDHVTLTREFLRDPRRYVERLRGS